MSRKRGLTKERLISGQKCIRITQFSRPPIPLNLPWSIFLLLGLVEHLLQGSNEVQTHLVVEAGGVAAGAANWVGGSWVRSLRFHSQVGSGDLLGDLVYFWTI